MSKQEQIEPEAYRIATLNEYGLRNIPEDLLCGGDGTE